jgi:phenylalanyl-tRNA synthetase beta chain
MQIPLSWLKEFVEIDVQVELLAEMLTKAGLEVSELRYIGVPQQTVEGVRYPVSDHLVWDRERLLLGAIREVKPHPDADRLVLAMVDYGGAEPEQCVTGAPNLFEYMGKGELNPPLWTAFAAEGAEVWDGHSDEPRRMILKGKPLRGIYNKSMVCSAKELGISEEHEGVILRHNQPKDPHGRPYAAGTPLQDVFGDVVLTVELTPNLARAYSVLGVAREVAALLDKHLHEPSYDVVMEGAEIFGQVSIDIEVPELNPRFTLALLRDTEVKSSPEWLQDRLRLCGQRPINNIVDVTNYVTFEIGQPLHAFDYDKLKARTKAAVPTIITRLPKPGETLETLDEIKRELHPENILVCDTEGVLGLGGIIGGSETEIGPETKNVLLEAANWNFINVRRTMQQQKVFTDAGVRFSRGVHPAQAARGVMRGIELMRQFGGGQVAHGIIDEYPLPAEVITVELPAKEIERLTGMEVPADQAEHILKRLQFEVQRSHDHGTLYVTVPPHRMDIGTGVIGQADLVEEIMRIIGYDEIPTTIMDDAMPEQWANLELEREEEARDLLVTLGLRENITYRFTTPEREKALIAPGAPAHTVIRGRYVEIANPISPDKSVMRQSLLSTLLEVTRANLRYQRGVHVFEIGSVYYYPRGEETPEGLPLEPRRVSIVMTGATQPVSWLDGDPRTVDFFDLKGVVEGLLDGLHLDMNDIQVTRSEHPSLHPGRSAKVAINGNVVGDFGELHPMVAAAYELDELPVMIADFDLDLLLAQLDPMYRVTSLPVTPAVLEDIALVVSDDLPAAEVEKVIWQAGGDLLKEVKLFDVYRGAPVPEGHKSLAYNLTYQTDERTLNDKEVASVRKKIMKSVEARLGAKVRS